MEPAALLFISLDPEDRAKSEYRRVATLVGFDCTEYVVPLPSLAAEPCSFTHKRDACVSVLLSTEQKKRRLRTEIDMRFNDREKVNDDIVHLKAKLVKKRCFVDTFEKDMGTGEYSVYYLAGERAISRYGVFSLEEEIADEKASFQKIKDVLLQRIGQFGYLRSWDTNGGMKTPEFVKEAEDRLETIVEA